MKKKNNSCKFKSSCCNAKVIICGIGDFDDKDTICTMHYECKECHMDCDVHIDERRFWTRNPKTQIIPNKKKKTSTKLTPKELKEIHQQEDF